MKQIFTKLFRCYAIIYCSFLPALESLGVVSHLNTSFKHFLYFVWEFKLIDNKEFAALQVVVDEMRSRYEREKKSI